MRRPATNSGVLGAFAGTQLRARAGFDPGPAFWNADERLATLASHESPTALLGHRENPLAGEIRALNADGESAFLHDGFFGPMRR